MNRLKQRWTKFRARWCLATARGRQPAKLTAGRGRLLIVHLGGIGDMLLLTAALGPLKRRYPEIEIDLAFVHGWIAELFSGHPYFRRIIPMTGNAKGYFRFAEVANPGEAREALLDYYPAQVLAAAREHYDAILVYALSEHMENMGGALGYFLKVPVRLGIGANRLGFYQHTVPDLAVPAHRVDLYRSLLPHLGLELPGDDRDTYVFPLTADEERRGTAFLREQAKPGRPVLFIHPGGENLRVPRQWAAERYAEVGRWFVDETAGTVVLTGGPKETDLCRTVAEKVGRNVVDTCGRFSLRETAAILRNASICLTNDTGMLHLAAAVSVPEIVAVFGSTDPALIVPRGHGIRVVQASEPDCVPCAGGIINNQTRECWQAVRGDCLVRVSAAMVIEQIREALGALGVNYLAT